MSLDITFVAIEQDHASGLIANPTDIDEFIQCERAFKFSVLLTGRWELLSAARGQVGFRSTQ